MYSILPPIRVKPGWGGGTQASHNPIKGIVIYRDIPFFAATLAQEIAEYTFRTTLTVLTAIVLGVGAYFLHPILVPVGVAFSILVGQIPFIARETEFRGQSIECQVMKDWYDHDLHVVENQAARQLKQYYSQFKKWSVEDIQAELVKRRDYAARWVSKRRKKIDKFYADQKR